MSQAEYEPAGGSRYGPGDFPGDKSPCGGRIPLISVVVPVRNEERFLGRTLEALVQQDYLANGYEVLVVDGCSTDRTKDVAADCAARHQCVRVLDNPKRLSSAARNIGIEASHGEIVLVIDGHCELNDRQYLRKLADAFARSGADCLGRPQPLDVSGATALQKAIAAARSSPLGHHPSSYIYDDGEGFVAAHSVAVAYRREVFAKVGLFDERFDACEDVELNTRIDEAGLRCFFSSQISVKYCPRETLGGLFRQLVRYGRGRVRLMRKHPKTISVGSLLPAAFVAGTIFGLPLCWLSDWLAVIYVAVLAIYLTAVVVISVSLVIRSGGAGLFVRLPAVFATIHIASGWGVLSELPWAIGSICVQRQTHGAAQCLDTSLVPSMTDP